MRGKRILSTIMACVLMAQAFVPFTPAVKAEAAVHQEEASVFSDIYTDKSRYNPGDTAKVTVEFHNTSQSAISRLVVQPRHLNKKAGEPFTVDCSIAASATGSTTFDWAVGTADYTGYMLEISAENSKDRVIDTGSVAVDVSSDWTKFPRYGYVREFEDGVDTTGKIQAMTKYHINVIEYYDWQHLHHQPLAPQAMLDQGWYTDWANRRIYVSTLKNYVRDAKNSNMASMAYDMIYAGTNSFFEGEENAVHKTWQIKFREGNSQGEGEFKFQMGQGLANGTLFFVNPLNKDWQTYIFSEVNKALDYFGFDGWHGDTVGDWGDMTDANGNPLGYDENGNPIYSVADTYKQFLDAAKDNLNGRYLTFNPVGAKGIENANKSKVDALYTEFWPWDIARDGSNYATYESLVKEIEWSAQDSGGKSLAVKSYINNDGKDSSGYMNTPAVMLVNAAVFAAGGNRVEIGNGDRILHNEYYPWDNVLMDDELKAGMRNVYDFAVAYENLLRDGQTTTDQKVVVENYPASTTGESNKIWTYTREGNGYQMLHLINLLGTDNEWRDTEKTKAAPTQVSNLAVKYYYTGDVNSVYLATPDEDGGCTKALPFEKGTDANGNYVKLQIPSLNYWDMIYMSAEEPAEDDAAAIYTKGDIYTVEAEAGTTQTVENSQGEPEIAEEAGASAGKIVKNIGLNQGSVEVTLPEDVKQDSYNLTLTYSSATSGSVNVWINDEKHTVDYAKTNNNWSYVPGQVLIGTYRLKAGDKIRIQDALGSCWIWADCMHLTKDTAIDMTALVNAISVADAMDLERYPDGKVKEAYLAAYEAAKRAAETAETQDEIDAAAATLSDLQDEIRDYECLDIIRYQAEAESGVTATVDEPQGGEPEISDIENASGGKLVKNIGKNQGSVEITLPAGITKGTYNLNLCYSSSTNGTVNVWVNDDQYTKAYTKTNDNWGYTPGQLLIREAIELKSGDKIKIQDAADDCWIWADYVYLTPDSTIETANLQKAIEEAETVDLSRYQSGSIKNAFTTALADAKNALKLRESQTIVDQAEAALTAAQSALKNAAYPTGILYKVEAESGTLKAEDGSEGPAVSDEASASDGKVVKNIGLTQGSVEITLPETVKTGTYQLSLCYSSATSGSVNVWINDDRNTVNYVKTTDEWVYKPGYLGIGTFSLKAGDTIKVQDAAANCWIWADYIYLTADTTALEQSIEEAEAVDLSKYKDGSLKTAFQTELAKAKAVLISKESQTIVDQAVAALKQAQQALQSDAYPDGMLYRIEAESGLIQEVEGTSDKPGVVNEGGASEGKVVKNIGLTQGSVEVTVPGDVKEGRYDLKLCYSSATSGSVNVWVNDRQYTVNYAKTNDDWSFQPESLLIGSLTLKAGDRIKLQDALASCWIWADYFYLTASAELDATALEAAITNAEAVNLDEYNDGSEKEAFQTALAAAKSALSEKVTQAAMDEAAATLAAAQKSLGNAMKPRHTYPDGILYRVEAESGTKAAVDQATDGPETAKDVNASEGAYVKNIGLNQGSVEVTLPDEVTDQNYCLNLCYSSSTSGAVNVWINGEKHTVSYAKTNGSWSYVPETLLLGSFHLKAGDKIKLQDAKEGCFIWADYVYLTKDTKTLTDVIAKAEALNLDNFEDGNAKNAFTEALANAKSVLANEDATQAQLDMAVSNLNLAISALDEIVQTIITDKLQQAVTDAKAIDLTQYKDGNVKEAFKKALADAESTLQAVADASTEITQSAVDAATAALTSAQTLLDDVKITVTEVDVIDLEAAVSKAEALNLANYQDGNAKNTFVEALKAAKEALEAKESQEAVNAATIALNTAISALDENVVEINTDKLEKAIEEADDIDLNNYKAGTVVEKFKTTLATAKEVLKAKESQSAIDAALAELQEARAMLADVKIETPQINVTKLETAISKAEALNLDEYQDGNAKNTFVAALSAAKEALEAKESQTAVNEAASALNTAMGALELKVVVVNTQNLAKAIADAKAVDLTEYKDGNVKEAFKKALTEAENAFSAKESQEAVDAAQEKLIAAQEMLADVKIEKPAAVDVTELQAAVTAAKAIDLKEYQDGDVKEAFTNALAEAESALAAKESQEKVDAALKVLTTAQKMLAYVKLEPQEIDVAELQTAISKAEALDLDSYEDGNAKNVFTEALKNAKAALAAKESQTAVNEAASALNTAMKALTKKVTVVNTDKLAKAIAAAEAVDLTDYQDGNVKNAFRAALTNAKAALAAKESQSAVDTALAALTNAQSALADVKINTNPVEKQYKISYYLRGGKNAAGNPTVCGTQKIVLKKPVRKGYTFVGWYQNNTKRITQIPANSGQDYNLYARWKKVTVKKTAVSKIKKASATSRKVTIKKVTGAKGYQISYSTSASFKKSATKTVYAKKNIYTIRKLKKNKKYYVRVRAYKLDSAKKKVYGKWSAKKRLK